MCKKTKYWLVLALFISLFLAGCRCDNSVIPTFFGIADSPSDGEITSLNPSFDWHGSESCEPDEYLLQVVEESSNTGGPILTNIAEAALPYTYPGSAFLPGRSYTWSLTAINGTTDTQPYVIGPKTEVGQFFTGPICSGETLIAPDLKDPEPAGWVEDDPYLFKWTYEGGCLPESYQIQFAQDPGFTNISMTVNTTEPYDQKLLMTFLDCTSLFWRVRAYDGSTYGPWSTGRDFHYILSSGCYQWHYMSEDFAWIRVSIQKDYCDQTGFFSAWTATLNPGCMADGTFIVGDGTMIAATLDDVVVDLGSGPCPSTGLDQKMAEYMDPFGVLTPGTYCVTVSRNQTADLYGPINMMDGIWTGPRTNSILVEETVTFGPGVADHLVRFVWDEIDRTLLTFPLEKIKKCYIGPEPHCPVVEFTEAGAAVPILGRDRITEWLLSEVNGTPCFLRLDPVLLEKYENEMGIRLADLEIFPTPDPCPKPETKPDPDPETQPKTCSDYATREECSAHSTDGCKWNINSLSCDGP